MISLAHPFRPGTKDDAAVLAKLVNEAGEGMPLYLWEQIKEPGETAWQVGQRRAAREEGGFSYRNAIMIEYEGQVAGALIGYHIGKEPEPISPDMPAMFRPLQELENLAPDTWYVNVLAVLPEFRGEGLGTRLLDCADEIGTSVGAKGMSVIVSDSNTGARRLYEKCGYHQEALRPMEKDGWVNDGENWVLLVKM